MNYIGDCIRDSVGLSTFEDGAYGRLLDQFYQTEKPLPMDRREVCRRECNWSTAEGNAVDYLVGKFFEEADWGYVHKQAMEVLSAYWDQPGEARSVRRQDNGRPAVPQIGICARGDRCRQGDCIARDWSLLPDTGWIANSTHAGGQHEAAIKQSEACQ